MEFVKTMMFLGCKRRSSERGAGYGVTMYCPGGEAWDFYVRDTVENNDIIAYLLRAASGTPVDVSYILGKTNDNRLYLRITHVCDAA